MRSIAKIRLSGLPARLLEAGLWSCVVVCAGIAISYTVEAKATQRVAEALEPGLASAVDAPDKAGAVMGRLEIKQIGLSVPVLQSYDTGTLKKGVGHIPGTAVPGGLGNMVLAGHRDTYFRPLRNVRAGMEIEVVTAEGRFRYLIDSMEVVLPDKVDILDIGNRPEMTLITCYPFEFVGSAPKRFIVHAHLLSVDAS